MIQATTGKLHWNYFIALERDLEVVSRYVEFCEPNYGVYSIELAHLLFAAASEVDVIAKLLCQRLAPDAPRGNIVQYRSALMPALPELPTTEVLISRYGLKLRPWDNWASSNNPSWWDSYNNVKHERDNYFQEATLKHALNALGALLILAFYHYRYALAPPGGDRIPAKKTTRQLRPESTLLRLQDDFYESHLIA